MEHVKMTVHEALCEVKVADKRIAKAIRDAVFVTANRDSNVKIDGLPLEDFRDQMASSYQKVTDLIRRVEAIKAALSLSNAVTKVSVNGQEMSVAEAIYLYQHGMDSKRALLQTMQNQLSNATYTVNTENGAKLDERTDRFIASTFGSRDKASPEDIRVATEDFKKKNSYSLVDPLGIKGKIDALQSEIDSFMTQVDSALQVSNATTFIEFDF